MSKDETPIYVSKTIVMQRLADLASRGYLHYVAGEVPAEKFSKLAHKFRVLYRVDQSHAMQSKRRKQGQAVFRVFYYSPGGPDQPPSKISFWLVRTDGEFPNENASREKWRSVLHDRVTMDFADYDLEMVRMARKGRSRPSFTWRVPLPLFREKKRRIALKTRRKDDLRRELFLLEKLPGFSEVRKQKKELYEAIEEAWKRVRRRSEDDALDVQKVVPWLRRLPDLTVPFCELGRRKRASRQKKPPIKVVRCGRAGKVVMRSQPSGVGFMQGIASLSGRSHMQRGHLLQKGLRDKKNRTSINVCGVVDMWQWPA